MIRRLLNWLFGPRIVISDENNRIYDWNYDTYNDPITYSVAMNKVIEERKKIAETEVCLKEQDLEEELGPCQCCCCLCCRCKESLAIEIDCNWNSNDEDIENQNELLADNTENNK